MFEDMQFCRCVCASSQLQQRLHGLVAADRFIDRVDVGCLAEYHTFLAPLLNLETRLPLWKFYPV